MVLLLSGRSSLLVPYRSVGGIGGGVLISLSKDFRSWQLYDYIGFKASLISVYHYGRIRLPDPMAQKTESLQVLS